MKVLLIGVFRDGTGYCNGAIEYAKALNSVSNVVCRTIKLNAEKFEPEELILKLEDKSAEECDINLQYILPSMMEYNGKMKNVGLFACETDYFGNSIWPEKLNLMDQVLVINKKMVEACNNSGVSSSKVIGHPINLKKCHSKHEEFNLPCTKNSFKFLFMGEMVRRKNLTALLKAFHLEFDPDEQIELVIKTSLYGIQAEQCFNQVKNFCNEIKKGLKLYPKLEGYKQEIIITNRLSEDDVMNLYNTCDVIVAPSYGEAWNIGVAECMAMGKTPIVTNNAGMDYINNDVGWVVNSNLEPCFGMNDTFADLYVGNENWWQIDINGLRKAMREAYEDNKLRNNKSVNGIDHSLNFSYDIIGKKIINSI